MRVVTLLKYASLFTGVRTIRARKKLSNPEKALLLTQDLQESSHLFLLDGLVFPKQIKSSTYYRFLEFDQLDKNREFRRLTSLASLTEESVNLSYDSIKSEVWKPIFEQSVEKLFMEKVVWGTNIKKAAGRFIRFTRIIRSRRC